MQQAYQITIKSARKLLGNEARELDDPYIAELISLLISFAQEHANRGVKEHKRNIESPYGKKSRNGTS